MGMTTLLEASGPGPHGAQGSRTDGYPGGEKRLYVQFYPWGDMRFKIGWLTNGRFEIQLREKRL